VKISVECGVHIAQALDVKNRQTRDVYKLWPEELHAFAKAIQAQTRKEVLESYPNTCKVYSAKTCEELIAAMMHHIEKLQSKLSPLEDDQPGIVRGA
jgi:hypothetical protein